MADKVPIRTDFDSSGNATGLSATASVNSSGVGTFGSLGGYNDSVAGIGSTFAQIYNVKVITND